MGGSSPAPAALGLDHLAAAQGAAISGVAAAVRVAPTSPARQRLAAAIRPTAAFQLE
jgi:hypothetical protein